MKLQINKRIVVGFGLAFVVVLALAFLSVQSLVNHIEGLAVFLTLILSGVFILIYWERREYRSVVADLQASEERFRNLVEMSPESIVTHTDGKIAFINRAGIKLFGAQRPEDLLGKPVLDFVCPESRAQVQERIRKTIDSGQPAPLMEMQLTRLDGTQFPAEVVSTPTTSGRSVIVQAMIRDGSHRQDIETQVRLLSATVRSVSHCISITDLFALPAKKFATTRATGIKLKCTSAITVTPTSATASAPSARESFIRSSPSPRSHPSKGLPGPALEEPS